MLMVVMLNSVLLPFTRADCSSWGVMDPDLLESTLKRAHLRSRHEDDILEYWRDNWTVSDVTGHAGVTGQYLANAIISDKSK